MTTIPTIPTTVKRKAFVLLSGGIDSTTCLHKAIFDFAPKDMAHAYGDRGILYRQGIRFSFKASGGIDWVEAISINYGQRHLKESEYAKKTCDSLGIQHTILNIGDILSGPSVMLTDKSVAIPDISYSEIQGVSPTYVPFRNGTLLSVITAYAQKWVNEKLKPDLSGLQPNPEAGIYFGAHSEDAQNWAYPDCTPEFIGAMSNAIYIGSYRAIRLYTPIQWATKQEIIQLGTQLGVNWANTWSCYAGNDVHCGICPTCRARKAGFEAAEVNDPTEYAA